MSCLRVPKLLWYFPRQFKHVSSKIEFKSTKLRTSHKAAREMKTLPLSTSGAPEIPIVGLGTWRDTEEDTVTAVQAALACGYRHLDTAFNYNNEEFIGKVLKDWFDSGAGTRTDLFITTKLPNIGNRPKDVEKFLNLSLERLQLDYVDLYLIHMPFSFKYDEDSLKPVVLPDGTFELDPDNDLIGTWKVMEEQVRKGKVKAIGISNFNEEQIQRIYDAAEIKPAVLQVEVHAYFQQKSLREFCKNLGIEVTAYSPLGSPGATNHFTAKYNYPLEKNWDLLNEPLVLELAEKYNKTSGQILLKHLVQQDVIVIPKSRTPGRIQSNIEIFDFELSEEDLEKLNELDKGEEGRMFHFKFFRGAVNHPEYPFKHLLVQPELKV